MTDEETTDEAPLDKPKADKRILRVKMAQEVKESNDEKSD